MPKNLSDLITGGETTSVDASQSTSSYEDVLDLARKTRAAHLAGDIAPGDLTPKGELLLGIGTGQVDPQGLTMEQRTTLGMAPTFTQRLLSNPLTRVEAPRQTGSVVETAFRPMQQAMSAPPPITTALRGKIPGANEPGPIDLGLTAAGGLERALQTFGGALAGGAGLVEQGMEQSPRLLGGEPVSSIYSKYAGALADAAGWLIGLPKAEKAKLGVPTGGLPNEPPPAMKAIGPGSNIGELVPKEFQRTGLALPSGKVPLALPAGKQTKAIGAGSNLGDVVPPESQYPGPGGPLGPPPKPMLALPSGEPTGVPRAGASVAPAGLPAVPAGDLPSSLEAGVRRRGQEPPASPEAPPAVPSDMPPLPGAPVGVKPELPSMPPPTKTRKATAFQERTAHVDAGSVDLSNPEEVLAFVRGQGGVSSTDVSVPLGVRNSKGLAFDELVDQVATAQNRNPKEVETAMSRALNRYSEIKKGRAGRPTIQEIQSGAALPGEYDNLPAVPEGPLPGTKPEPPPTLNPVTAEATAAAARDQGVPPSTTRWSPEALAERPPADIAHMVDTAEWAGMTPQSRTSLMEWMRTEGAGVEPLNASGSVEPPKAAAPFVEKTAIGDQAVIPGAEARAIPTSKTPPPSVQKPVDTTPLFGQEKAAAQEASDAAQQSLPGQSPPKPPKGKGPSILSMVPPIPLPGPEPGQEDTPEGKAQRLAQIAGLTLPLAAAIIGRMRARPVPGGSPPRASGAPPEVPAAFRREEVGPSRPMPQENAPPLPSSAPEVRVKAQQAVNESKVELSGQLAGGGGGFRGGPTAGMNLPGDSPAAPMPPPGRAARFFSGLKALTSVANTPEDVLRGDPAGNALVRLTYRSYENGKMLTREFDEALGKVINKVSDADLEKIKKVMDTGQGNISPEQAQIAAGIRNHLDVLADSVGLPRSDRIENYFPRLRDTVKMETTRLVLDPSGVPYMGRTFMDSIADPKRWEPFFMQARTATDEAGLPAREALAIYNRATARHLTMNGGMHPFSGEAMPGYLNQLQPLLGQQTEVFKPYLGELVNYYLGVPGSRPGSDLGHQISRTIRNVEFSRLIGGNLGSPIANMTQQVNTLAHVSPVNFFRGYADMLDPARRAVARQWIGLEEMGKVDLERVQQAVTTMDKIEDFTGKLANVSGAMFRLSETQGNRYHAFLAGLREAEGLGLQGRTAIELARDIVERTQFPGAGPAKIAATRGPVGGAIGQFKQFQIRQMQAFKNMVEDDVKDWGRLLQSGTKLERAQVPVEVMGRPVMDAAGQPVMRPVRIFPRTAKFLVGLAALGGPDAILPGLDDYLREQGVKVPGLLPGIGVGIANMMGYGIQPGDVTRSLLFFLPGPVIGHVQDMASAASGVNFGSGLTEMLHGDLGRELTVDERTDRALRGFLPVAGVTAARGRRALKQYQTPGEERMALTVLEALGLNPATGPLQRRTEPAEGAKVMLGLPPASREQQFQEAQKLGNLDAQSKLIVERAANQRAAGDPVTAEQTLRAGEEKLGLPPGSLTLQKATNKAAEQRRLYTPLERQQHNLQHRFPLTVEESRQRTGGEQPPDARGLKGLSVPRPRIR